MSAPTAEVRTVQMDDGYHWTTGHEIVWSVDRWGTVEGKSACVSPEGSWCRVACLMHPEDACALDGDRDGCDFQPYAFGCVVTEWWDASGEMPYGGPDASVTDGPILVRWDGDGYVWRFPGGAS